VAATLDESGNFVDLHFGPLSVMDQATGTTINGNYHLAGASGLAYNTGTNAGAPARDYDGDTRPQGGVVDKGADEFLAPAVAIASITGGPLQFGNVALGTTSAAGTLTLHNTGTANLTGITIAATPAQFSRPAGAAGGSCGATLAPAATCTVSVVFAPSALGAAAGTLAVTANVAVTGSPVALAGTGVVRVASASLSPSSWTVSETRTCPGTTLTQIANCLLGPTAAFTLTNTGNVPLTGVTQASLGGASPADFAVVPLLSTCGNAANTTLAPGASCVVRVQFRARLSDPANSVRNATVSVTDSAGTQTAALIGTAQ